MVGLGEERKINRLLEGYLGVTTKKEAIATHVTGTVG